MQANNSLCKFLRINFSLFLLVFRVCVLQGADASAEEIIKKSAERFDNNYLYSEISMQVIRTGWENELGVKAWARGDDYAMVVITSPAKDRGNAFLKREDNLWHWIPNVQRTVRMSASLLNLPWMGTDFSMNDLFNNHFNVSEYSSLLLESEVLRDQDCYVVELVPKDGLAIVWSSIRVWVTKDNFDQLQLGFYDDNGQLVQLLEAFQFEEYGGRRMPVHVQITPLTLPGNKTVVRVLHYDLDLPIDNDFFSIQNLKRRW